MDEENKTPSLEMPTQPDGTPNPKYIDFLQTDPPIAGQSFACCSFISPETIVRSAETFYFEKYVQQFGVQYFAEIMHTFVMFIKDKYKLNPDAIQADLNDFISNEKQLAEQLNIQSQFTAFKREHITELRNEYKSKNPLHKCTVRAFKVRGVYDSESTANERASEFQALEPSVSTFVGRVGWWQIFDPTGATDTKYMEPELNALYATRMANQKKAEELFQERVRNEKMAALEANQELCKQTNNKPTQILDENGNLINTRFNKAAIEEREEADEEGTLNKNMQRRDELVERATTNA